MEDSLGGAVPVTDREVVTDGNVITSRGMGTAIPFGLAIMGYLSSQGMPRQWPKDCLSDHISRG